jgi:hypothetical protein
MKGTEPRITIRSHCAEPNEIRRPGLTEFFGLRKSFPDDGPRSFVRAQSTVPVACTKPLPACFSFAVSAVFADEWRRAQWVKCSALQARARQQMREAGLFPDAEFVLGGAARTIVKFAKQYRADLVVMGRHRTIRIDHLTTEVTELSTCAVLGVP